MGRSAAQTEKISCRWTGTIRTVIGALLFVSLAFLILPGFIEQAYAQHPARTGDAITLTVVGRVVNTQALAVSEAEVRVFLAEAQAEIQVAGEEVLQTTTDARGYFFLDLTVPEGELTSDATAIETSIRGTTPLVRVLLARRLRATVTRLFYAYPIWCCREFSTQPFSLQLEFSLPHSQP